MIPRSAPLRLLTVLPFIGIIPLLSSSASGKELRSVVTSVEAGERFTVEVDGEPQPVRIQGVDAPDVGQPLSEDSRKALEELILGKEVRVKIARRDLDGTVEGIVFLERENVGRWLVAEGWAWRYFRQAAKSSYSRAETDARLSKKGVWSQDNPIPPWERRNPSTRTNDLEVTPEAAAKEARLVERLDPEAGLEIQVGLSRMIRTTLPIVRFSVGAPEIARVAQSRPHEFEVVGRTAGETTLNIWFADAGRELEIVRYSIRVVAPKGKGASSGHKR